MPVWKLLHRQAASVGSMLAVMIAAIVDTAPGARIHSLRKGCQPVLAALFIGLM